MLSLLNLEENCDTFYKKKIKKNKIIVRTEWN